MLAGWYHDTACRAWHTLHVTKHEGCSYGIGLASSSTGNDDRDVSADKLREALWFVEIYLLSHAE